MEITILTGPKKRLKSPRVILLESKIWEKDHSYHVFITEEDNAEKKSMVFHVPRRVYEEKGAGLGIGDPFCCEYDFYEEINYNIVTKIKPQHVDRKLGNFERSHEKDDEKQKEDEEEDYER